MVKVLRGRRWGGLLALGGVVLAVPSVIWPTLRLSQEPVDVTSEIRGPSFVQDLWSWGRYSFEGSEGPAETITNVLGLVFVVLALVSGLVGSLIWLTQRGAAARLLGAAGAALALTEVAHSALQRLGQLAAGFYGGDFGPEVRTTLAGMLEYAAALVLAAALVVMLWPPMVVVGRPLWREVSERAARARRRDEDERADERGVGGRAGGVTVVGDTLVEGSGSGTSGPPPVRPSRLDLPPSSPPLEEEGVGFSDRPGDDDRYPSPPWS